MTLRHIRLNSVPCTFWKNGAGTTRLLIERPDWRLSVATISRAAPFSSFPGLFRQMGLLTGDGVRLLPPTGALPLLLDQHGDLLRFSGDLPLTGTPLNGSVNVLNLMRSCDRSGPNLISIKQDTLPSNVLLGFMPVEGQWDVMTGGRQYTLAPGDMLLDEAPFELSILTPGQIAYGIS